MLRLSTEQLDLGLAHMETGIFEMGVFPSFVLQKTVHTSTVVKSNGNAPLRHCQEHAKPTGGNNYNPKATQRKRCWPIKSLKKLLPEGYQDW